jgi:hypothetical protein
MKKILATITALVLAAVAFAAPVQANDDDVRFNLMLAKMAWTELSYYDQENLCDYWYTFPKSARNEMASIIREAGDYEISVYDSRRVAYRLLNWAC